MSPINTRQLTLRTLLIYVSLGLGLLLFSCYALFQARFVIAGPQITLTTPLSEVYESRTIVLEGQVQNVVSVTLNGRSIYTDESGYFKETLVLENGYTVATIQAQDRYGRTIQKSQSFVYQNEVLETNS